jgi:TPR repeat protein
MRSVRPIFALAAALVILLPPAGLRGQLVSSDQGKRYALVVGVGAYRHDGFPAVPTAEEDAAGLAAILECARFETVLLSGAAGKDAAARLPTRANIEKQLAALQAKTKKGDVLLVALAGNGLRFEWDRDCYFCPLDAAPPPGDEGHKTLLSLKALYQQLGKAAAVKVLLIDACRPRGIDGGSVPRPPGGVAVLASCSAGEHATDRPGSGHGRFFYQVMEGLRSGANNARGEVDWDGLSEFVRREVAREAAAAGAKQTPAPAPGELSAGPAVLVRRSDALSSHALLGIQYSIEAEAAGTGKAEILFILPGSGAERMGLRRGDELARVNGKDVRTLAEANKAFGGLKLGDRVAVEVRRGGRPVELVGRFASPFSAERDLPRLLDLAEKDAAAAFSLSSMYGQGKWLLKDEREAVRWCRRAAEAGNARAQMQLGAMYLEGSGGLPKDSAEAIKWSRKAADGGSTNAQLNLAIIYLQGLAGVRKDPAQAVKWSRKAAEAGNARAQLVLGTMYLQGLGGLTKDGAAAVRWFRKAADQDEVNSQFNLGVLHERGLAGLARDRAEAVRWYRRAAALGHREAAAALKRLGEAP